MGSVRWEFEAERREVAETDVYLGLFGVDYGYD